MIKPIKVGFDWNIFLNAEYNTPDYSCITHQQTYDPDFYKLHGGIPDRYTKYNTTIRQVWWNDETLKQQLGDLLGIYVVSISAIEQPPGQTIPIHQDHFYKIKTKFPDDPRTHVRANIFLEDWKFGHILQYEDEGEWYCPTHWKQGQGFIWDSQISHLSGNSGLQPKYTLQVSGFLL